MPFINPDSTVKVDIIDAEQTAFDGRREKSQETIVT